MSFERKMNHKDSTILDTQRQAQVWQAQEYMMMYSRDRTEGLKTKLEHHPKGGQIQKAMEELCYCPMCQWAQWAVSECECIDTWLLRYSKIIWFRSALETEMLVNDFTDHCTSFPF